MKKYQVLFICLFLLTSCDFAFFNSESGSECESISESVSLPNSETSESTLAPFNITYHLNGGSFERVSNDLKTSITINYYNDGYWTDYKNGIFLYDSKTITDPKISPIYAYKIGLKKYNLENEFKINQIVYEGESLINNNKSDYYIIVHAENPKGYDDVVHSNLSIGDVMRISKDLKSLNPGKCTMFLRFYEQCDVFSLKYYSEVKSLPTPIKNGIDFLGWYNNSSLNGKRITHADQNMDLYACWKESMESKEIDIASYRSNDLIIYGNDISRWQGTNDFAKMSKYSRFLIIKIGGNDKNSGCYEDGKFITNVRGCIANNIPFGLYFYSGAYNEEIAKKEAKWCLDTIKKYNLDKGVISYPIFMDFEDSDDIYSHSKSENRDTINAFANTIKEAGFYPGVYTGAYHMKNNIDYNNVICDFWLAIWWKGSAKQDKDYFFSSYNNKRVTMWQFDDGLYNDDTLSGATLGAGSSNVDQDYCFVDYPKIIKERHLNGY